MQPNQHMQKDLSSQVRIHHVFSALLSYIFVLFPFVFYKHVVLLLKDEHHGGHATDEEKLASSVGVKPDKDESSESQNQ